MNSLEKIIYQTALNDKKLQFQLCNHIQVSDEYLNILGNRVQTLDEVSNKMVLYYEKNIISLEKKIINLNALLENENSDTINNTLIMDKDQYVRDLNNHKARLNIFNKLDKKVKEDTSCPICLEEFQDLVTAIPNCGHFICSSCLNIVMKENKAKCPLCKTLLKNDEIRFIQPENFNNSLKIGTKISKLLEIVKVKLEEDINNKFIIFSQWEGMLKLLNKLFLDNSINSLILNGNYHMINNKIRKFRFGIDNRVILLSSEKSNSGLTLTEATHIILVDTLHEDKEYCDMMEKQAIGRAVRIGQTKKVEVIRLVMKDTIENEYIR